MVVPDVVVPALDSVQGVSLSGLEKYLLRLGWIVDDRPHPVLGVLMSYVTCPETGKYVRYPHPAHHYHHLDRNEIFHEVMQDLSAILNRDYEDLLCSMALSLQTTPQWFSCSRCGCCCTGMADAYRGKVSFEEFSYWTRKGLDHILARVQVVRGEQYTQYRTWVDPETGRYHERCPWVEWRSGLAYCRIHEHRPLKCRSFPLSRNHAEQAGCLHLLS